MLGIQAVANAGIFYVATSTMQSEYLSSTLGRPVDEQDLTTAWLDALSPMQLARLDGYEELLADNIRALESGADGRLSPAKWLSSVFIADLDHNPADFARCGHMMPALLRHGVMMEVKNPAFRRPLLPDEHLLVQGIPVYPSLHGGVYIACPFPAVLDSLQTREKKSGAGNGMSLKMVASYLAFMLAGLRPRDDDLRRNPCERSDPEDEDAGDPPLKHARMDDSIPTGSMRLPGS